MTEAEMFERSFQRPRDYFLRDASEQWEIDRALGILDWVGDKLTEAEIQRCADYYRE